MNFLNEYSIEDPSKNVSDFLKNISIGEISSKNYFIDLLKPSGREYLAFGDNLINIHSKFFSKLNDKKVAEKRQEIIKDFSYLIKNPKSKISFYLFFSNMSKIKEMEKNMELGNSFDLRDMGPLYFNLVNSLQKIRPLLKNKKNLESLANYFEFVFGKSKELIEGGRYFGSKGKIMHIFDTEESRLINLCNEPIKKSKTINYQLGEVPSDEAEKVFALKDNFNILFENLGVFYAFANYFNYRKENNLPICFPNLDEDGAFEVVNGNPIASECEGEKITLLNEKYNKTNNHLIYSGAHSGGKTHRLATIGLYYLYGLAGVPLPCDFARIPLTNNFYALMERGNVVDGKGKGSLESEVKEIISLSRKVSDEDLVLIDEFLDTTKPEFTKYLSVPILKKFDEKKSAIHIVYHAAQTIIHNETSFRFKHPEIKYRMPKSLAQQEGFMNVWAPTGKRYREYYGTYNFLDGFPNGELVKKHSAQRYDKIKKDYEGF